MATNPKGKVYLIGAGPGDAGLLTIKGKRCLEKAEVVVYDRLVNPALLAYAPREAERIYAGKAPHRHAMLQEEINALLVEKARAGKIVARLKGGDPFIFGRGGEEALALAEAGIPFEVVPGVTSAVAAPAYAGIPVTHRGLASTVTFITGNEDPQKEQSEIDWQAIAQNKGTLVFLMGMANLGAIADKLVAYGRPPETPVTLIRWGTRAEQETLSGTLADIESRAKKTGFSNPAVILVGEVTRLREELAWAEKRPLFGRRIVITRPRQQAQAMAEMVEDLGGEALIFPVIRTLPPLTWEPLDQALRNLQQYDWAIFTSANGVNFFFDRLKNLGLDVRRFYGVRLAAIGPATAAALEERGLIPDFQPAEYRAEAIAAGLAGRVDGKKVLLPRADIARPLLAEELRRAGAEVTEVAAYRTVPAGEDMQGLKEMLAEGKIAAVTFTSSSTVKNLLHALGPEARDLLARTALACIGPVTAATAREAGLKVAVTAQEYTVPGLVAALTRYFGGEK
ncbi:MAG: uroporphyrinogen methyltransferase / synthase [Clostridia bacterium]|nr:uroporphyrinogen methyltransferase / synthase [Clostridia bacterium]